MNPILKAIERHVASAPASVALAGDNLRLSYAALQEEIQNCCARLQHAGIQRLGLLMDNNPAWAVVDLAALSQRIVLVPLPAFFSDEQLIHAINSAGLDSILTDQPSRLAKLLPESRLRPWPRIAGRDVWLTALSVIQPVMLPADTAKITFTSGTTGQPKGVCLTEHTIMNVAQALAQLIDIEKHDRHLCLLPLAVLLENIAGLYVALLRGVPCSLPSMDKLGSDGASGIDVMKMFSRVAEEQATSVIMIPQMLQALVMCVEQGLQLPQLRFAAVGGASVSPQLLERALQLGLPVYEGYGLSECASVVAVNNPQAKRPGSVGRPLPHVRVTIADDGEILIDADVYAGYLGEAKRKSKIPLATGDLGHLDEDGYLYVTGRKKNVYITSFGRNVSPEWVESELSVQPAIAQAVVFGEAQPWATAVVVPRSPATMDDIDVTIHSVNQGLPEYARIGHWLMADEAFTPLNEQLTANGRPRRDVIWRHYADRINQLYENQVVNG